MAVLDGAFGDLRKLADWFSTSPQRASLHIERITRRLGRAAVPLLARELRSVDVRRRDAARECLASLATGDTRERVIAALRAILDEGNADEIKVCTLGLLAELGEHAEARFEDPRAMQRRSAIALAQQLETAADVASAADMMVHQLDDTAILQMIEALIESAPDAALRLSQELGGRIDLDLDVRERILAMTSSLKSSIAPAKRIARPVQVAVLVDASARFVVVASRKLSGERRWRRWAVLIGPAGHIEDCLHEEAVPRTPNGEDADAAPLIASLVADGYRVVSSDLDHARTVVATAARISAARADQQTLTSAYYLGRDLLDLGDAHVGPRRDPETLALARAIELLADNEPARAAQLLARCTTESADQAATLAACALAQNNPADAVEPLARAIALEPAWPLHHWNLAAACHALGDAAGTYHALRRFLATSARPTALHGDPDQPARIVFAQGRLVELERAARLAGTALKRSNRRRAKSKRA
jgi:tetratricopeptide (TPR) repeat protein